jgi:hypothetical protein
MKDMLNRWLPLTFRVFAVIAALLGVAFFFVILIGGGTPEAPRATSILALILGFFYFVFFWTVAYVINLMEGILANTQD